jgi:hypothetical protein
MEIVVKYIHLQFFRLEIMVKFFSFILHLSSNLVGSLNM